MILGLYPNFGLWGLHFSSGDGLSAFYLFCIGVAFCAGGWGYGVWLSWGAEALHRLRTRAWLIAGFLLGLGIGVDKLAVFGKGI